jgi:hypothetical protein
MQVMSDLVDGFGFGLCEVTGAVECIYAVLERCIQGESEGIVCLLRKKILFCRRC